MAARTSSSSQAGISRLWFGIFVKRMKKPVFIAIQSGLASAAAANNSSLPHPSPRNTGAPGR
jgi:hypothetical protein